MRRCPIMQRDGCPLLLREREELRRKLAHMPCR